MASDKDDKNDKDWDQRGPPVKDWDRRGASIPSQSEEVSKFECSSTLHYYY
jgi:hypothetical protein